MDKVEREGKGGKKQEIISVEKRTQKSEASDREKEQEEKA